MYNLALSVTACLRAGTRVDVAWPVSSDGLTFDPGVDAVALTPGGGRVGGLLGGALDAQLSEVAQGRPSAGRIIDLTVNDVDATVAGLPQGGHVACALVPASDLPDRLWPLLLAREPVCLVSTLAGSDITATTLHDTADLDEASAEIAATFRAGTSVVTSVGDDLVTVLWPVPRLVVSSGGPIAEALAAAAPVLGWQVIVAPQLQDAIGLMAGLSSIDSAVIIGHDVEASSRVLAAALDSPVGYIGALGSLRMQQQREGWLAYRGITDLSRVNGPAGVDIGAETPGEIAISILAEAIAARRGRQ
ncbi:XdhC family protein [Nitriliruptor alkaliphilus]|uniref:XdhC family protein n=1 Tax=Nitriliruptor alkaliphilus TaxID=427918 RepID=UPI0012ECEE59|nr:XdhC family protein [Nitriliruptor alkaliphilus]